MIGQSIKIKGEVTGGEDLIIRGSVEGSIDLGNNEVTIGETGKVQADIKGKTVIINGQVTGDVAGGEKVVISKTGHVRGNIVSPRVTLEDGAVFKGSIDMDPGDAAKRGPSAAPQAAPQPKMATAPKLDEVKNG